MLQMELSGKRFRGRQKRRFRYGIYEDMIIVGLSVEDANDSASWREAICCGDPNQEKPKEIIAKTLFEHGSMLYAFG